MHDADPSIRGPLSTFYCDQSPRPAAGNQQVEGIGVTPAPALAVEPESTASLVERLRKHGDFYRRIEKPGGTGDRCHEAADEIRRMGALYWKGKFELAVQWGTGQRFWAEKERKRADEAEARLAALIETTP